MENASKALIIAGAVLLSILLISLGIAIFNMATPDTNSVDELNVSSFNQKFTKYEGSRVKGAQVRSLINEVIAANSNQANIDNGINITVNKTFTNNNGNANNTADVRTASFYAVTCNVDATTGYITSIDIADPS